MPTWIYCRGLSTHQRGTGTYRSIGGMETRTLIDVLELYEATSKIKEGYKLENIHLKKSSLTMRAIAW
ncbi:MAG: hypothetical protein ACOYEG_01970 [Petrimonas sp.]|jgi:hypothetical protein